MKSKKEKNKVESLTKTREITFSTKSQPSKSATPKTCFVLWGNNVYFFRFLLRHQLVESPHCLDLVSFNVPIRVDWEKSIMRLSTFKVARYSFSWSIPPKLEHKLSRQKQSFGKIATTVVLDEEENLSWSGLQRHRSCHGNEMTLLHILLTAAYLGTGNCSSKINHGSSFLQKQPRCSWSLSEICKSVIEIFWDKVFIVRNTVKNGQYCCLAVTCRKLSAFDMKFHLIVVSIFLKSMWKVMGDSSSRLLERRVWLVCIEELLLAVL